MDRNEILYYLEKVGKQYDMCGFVNTYVIPHDDIILLKMEQGKKELSWLYSFSDFSAIKEECIKQIEQRWEWVNERFVEGA